MDRRKLRNLLGGTGETDRVDCLTICLASYFEHHQDRPEDDPVDDETGWGLWVTGQTLEMLDRIAEELQPIIKEPS